MSAAAVSLVGVVPAAGRATQLPRLPASKEIVLLDPLAPAAERTPLERLLRAMAVGGAARAYVLLGEGKWDIAAYAGAGDAVGVPLAYLNVGTSPSTPTTVRGACPFVEHDVVAFGFPDIVFEPADAFVHLRRRLDEGGADVVLGLFPAERPELVDMVETDASGRVRAIVVKPHRTRLREAWILAVWTAAFTRFLRDWVDRGEGGGREPYIGDVVQAAVDAGLEVDTVRLAGTFLDLGTPAELSRALRGDYGVAAGPRPIAR